MSSRRTRSLIDGAMAIGSGTIAVRALSVVLAMGLGRILGPSGLGTFFTLMAAAEVAGLIADLGVGVNLSRAAGPLEDREALSVLREALVLRVLLTVPAAGVFLGYVVLTRGSSYLVAAGVLAVYIALNGIMVVLRQWTMGRARFAIAGRSLVLTQATLVGTAIAAAVVGFGVTGLAAAEAVSAMVGCTYLFAAQRSWLVGLPGAESLRSTDARRVMALLLASLPLGLAGLLATAYSRFDLALVSYLVGDAEAGLYGAALQPYLACTALAGVLYSVVVPNVARALPSSGAEGPGPWDTATFTHAAGWLLAGLVYSVSELAVRLLYGKGFSGAVPVLQVMSFALPAVFYSNVVLGRAVGQKRLSLALWVGLLGVAGTVGLEMLLVPSIGSLGAAYSTFVVETAIAALLAVAVLRSPVLGFGWLWLLGAAVFGALVGAQQLLQWPALAVLPFVLACAALVLTRARRLAWVS